MKRARRFLWGVFFISGGARGAFEEKPFSARTAGMGGAMVAVLGETESAFYNPAGMRFSRGPSFASGHTRAMGFSELAHSSLSGVWPTEHWGDWGVFLTDFGSGLYREREAGLAFAAGVGPRAGVGAVIRGQELAVRRYGKYGAIQVDLGFAGRPNPKTGVGMAVRNITESPLRGISEAPRAVFSAGASREFWSGGLTSLAAVQEAGGRSSWRVGQEITPHPALALRAGYETDSGRFALGMGIRRGAVAVDYALVSHPTLPDQHHFGLTLTPPGP